MPEPRLNDKILLAASRLPAGCRVVVYFILIPVVDAKMNVAIGITTMARTVVSTMVTMLSFHSTVMFFPCMFFCKVSRMSMPRTIMMAIGMMPLIVSIPAWCVAVFMMAIMLTFMPELMTFPFVMCEFWRVTPLGGMAVAGDCILRQYKSDSCHCSQ